MQTNSRKTIKALAIGILLGVILYNSVYFKSLEEYQSESQVVAFDAAGFAQDFMDHQRETVNAMPMASLLDSLDADFKDFLPRQGRQLGISHDFYFMVAGAGVVQSVSDENITLQLDSEPDRTVDIATGFIYGNAVREASQMAQIGDYQNTMDFNSISIETNKIITEEVVAPVKGKVQVGDVLQFKGAVRLNDKKTDYDRLRIIPLMLNIKNNN